MLPGILILAFLSAFALFRQLFPNTAEDQARQSLGIDGKPRVVRSVLLKWSRPFFLRLMPLVMWAMPQSWAAKRKKELIAGDLLEEVTVEELWAYKFFMVLLALFLVRVFAGHPAWWFWVAASLAGFLFPEWWLRERVKRRKEEIRRALPHTVDMLALSVEAGLDFMQAIARLVTRTKANALVNELSRVLSDVRFGASRSDALRNMSQRCDIIELSSFVAILVQADNLGVSVGSILKSQSERMVTERFQKAERLGAQASQKILFPLVFCIMPAVFIVILGPLIIKYAFGLN